MTATTFTHARVRLTDAIEIVVDGNSKITAGNGTFDAPTPNAFSLPAASVGGARHCPGSTKVCRASCYVRGLAVNAPDVYAAYAENAVALDAILADGASTVFDATALAFGRWIAANCRGGFRWHVSGDVRDGMHALWIAQVCFVSPDVAHWIYTRTLGVVHALTLVPNLAVNVSADRDNYEDAREVATRYGARVAYMATDDGHVPADLPAGSVVFPDYALRGRALTDPTSAPWWRGLSHETRTQVCPADFFSQSESARCGPCAKCLRK